MPEGRALQSAHSTDVEDVTSDGIPDEEIIDPDELIRETRASIELLPEDQRQADTLSELATLLFDRYKLTGNLADLDEAIALETSAVDNSQSDLEEAISSHQLSALLFARYRRRQSEADIAKVGPLPTTKTDKIPDDLNDAADGDHRRCPRDVRELSPQEDDDLVKAIGLTITAIDLVATDYYQISDWLVDLGYWHFDHYYDTGIVKHLQEAIRVTRQGLETSTGIKDPLSLHRLGHLLNVRYHKLKKIDDLREAVDLYKQALACAPDETRYKYYKYLADNLFDLYHATGRIENLDEAIQAVRKVLNHGSYSEYFRLCCTDLLGDLLFDRHEKRESMSDLDEAIRKSWDVADVMFYDCTFLDFRRLMVAYWEGMTGAMLDYTTFKQTFAHISSIDLGGLTQAGSLHKLRHRLGVRYKKLKKHQDVSHSVRVIRSLLEQWPNNEIWADLAVQLCNIYHDHDRRATNLLGEAQSITRRLVSEVHEGPDRARYFDTLCDVLLSRYRITGDASLVDEAIMLRTQSIDMVHEHRNARVLYLDGLGGCHYRKYCMTRIEHHLEEAVRIGREAVSLLAEDYENPARVIGNLSYALLQRYRVRNSTADLEEAISFGRKAVIAVPEHAMSINSIIPHQLSIALYERYLKAGDMADLEEAIRLSMQAITAMEMQSARLEYQPNLASLLCERYIRTGSLSDLSDSVRWAMETTSWSRSASEHRSKVTCHFGLGGVYWGFGYGDSNFAQECIRHNRANLDSMRSDHPHMARHLSNFAIELLSLVITANGELYFENHKGKIQPGLKLDDVELTIDEAIKCARTALTLIPDDHPDLPWHLCCLAIGLNGRFWQTNKPCDIDAGVTLGQRAVKLARMDHPGRPFYLNVCSAMLRTRYAVTGRLPDLYESIRLCLEALSLSDEHSQEDRYNRLMATANLANCFWDRYLREGATDDHDQANIMNKRFRHQCNTIDQRFFHDLDIGCYSMHLGTGNIIAATGKVTDNGCLYVIPQDFTDLLTRLFNAGNAKFTAFEESEYAGELSVALTLSGEALFATPLEHAARPARAHLLGQCHEAFHVLTQRAGGNLDLIIRNLKDLSEAIYYFQEVIDIGLEDTETWKSSVHRLSSLYEDRFQCEGDLADLKMMLEISQESVNITPMNDRSRAKRLFQLGDAKMANFDVFGHHADIEAAIEAYKGAQLASPQDPSMIVECIFHIGSAYHQSYDVTKDESTLDLAMRLYEEAQEKSVGQASPRISSCLGWGFVEKFNLTGSKPYLEIAVSMLKDVINGISRGSPQKSYRLLDLAQCYLCAYRKTGSTTYLDLMLPLYREATDATPTNHLYHLTTFSLLGDWHMLEHRLTKTTQHLDDACEAYLRAFWGSRMASPDILLSVARSALPALITTKKWKLAFELACEAKMLILSHTPRHLETSENQVLLSQFAGLTSLAAAVSLSSGHGTGQAMQFLDEGRGIAARLLYQLRTSGSGLSKLPTNIRNNFLSYRDQFEIPKAASGRKPGYTAGDDQSALRVFTRRLAASTRLDAITTNYFFDEMDELTLNYAAARGPIVVINVSYRCDAFLIKWGEQRVLPLPMISQQEIEEKSREGSLGKPEVLEWLWDTTMRPILHALGFTRPPSDDHWPHVWWIPTGSLTRFPLHAAGYHTEGSGETVIDRVMSSYSSSISALLQGRTLYNQKCQSDAALVVAMEDTPECSRLQFAKKEIAVVRELCESMSLNPVEPERRTDEVLSHLQSCRVFHFAGHGYTDVVDPSKSHLRLVDWKENPLRVADMLRVNLRESPPFLAYLSACGTGRINDENYLDENIHLISACQLAGFRNVIGTLWEVKDDVCVDMARMIYGGIKEGGLTDDSVCRGLHIASRELRDRWVDSASMSETRRSVHAPRDRWVARKTAPRIRDGVGGSHRWRLSRDVVPCDDISPASWAPYIHFGV